MNIVKSFPDLERLRGDPLHAAVEKILTPLIADSSYVPDEDGFLVLIEEDDVHRVLSELDMPWRLSEVPFEGVTMVD